MHWCECAWCTSPAAADARGMLMGGSGFQQNGNQNVVFSHKPNLQVLMKGQHNICEVSVDLKLNSRAFQRTEKTSQETSIE